MPFLEEADCLMPVFSSVLGAFYPSFGKEKKKKKKVQNWVFLGLLSRILVYFRGSM